MLTLNVTNGLTVISNSYRAFIRTVSRKQKIALAFYAVD